MRDAAEPERSVLGRIPPARRRRRLRWRLTKNGLATHGVRVGGIGVIVAILLIFFYLLYVVMPLLAPADAEAVAEYPAPGGDAPLLHVAMEEQAEIGVAFRADGGVTFFGTADGEPVKSVEPPLPRGASVTALGAAAPHTRTVALGLSNGAALVMRHAYRLSYPDDVRVITPVIEYPLGEAPLQVDPEGRALTRLAVQNDEDRATLVAATEDGRLLLLALTKQVSFLDESVTLERTESVMPNVHGRITHLAITPGQESLYVAGADGRIGRYDISDPASPRLIEHLPVADSAHGGVQRMDLLAGGISLLVAAEQAGVSQWFPVRQQGNQYTLTRIRGFEPAGGKVTAIAPEHSRKAFALAYDDGRVSLHHTTAHRRLLVDRVAPAAIEHLAMAPRADALLAADRTGTLHFWRVDNEHPEVSWSALWGQVWYESYPEPEYVWQSSSASNDFEPKFSLVPLSFGTMKAAFYAMLIAMPLSILGAIYTAYFMAPRMRQVVKPTVEIMEALPTVILGFLAGLWLAPFMEDNLPGIISLLLILPAGVLLVSLLWHMLPDRMRRLVPEGWEAALLLPVIVLIGVGAIAVSQPVEHWLFGGDVQQWLSVELGIDYDQRNALVVGLAMGFAVIPTIFSIAEDAIFNVPRHLVQGSLALGATHWQTLLRVVLLTASPGIFSGIMIGLGRAVGETMIVLMATGNTPVMDFSIFQGMRTLSANIAVEMPESEVNSTHYRILFLAALVLFLFTFVLNTGAEMVRHRLRRKYSSL